MPLDEDGNYDSSYEKHFLDVKENEHHLPPGYYDRVREATKASPHEYQRMVLGVWVDVPAGEAIFKPYFNETLHIAGAGRERRSFLL